MSKKRDSAASLRGSPSGELPTHIAAFATSEPWRIGSKTPWGEIAAMGTHQGERFYMAIDKHEVVTLLSPEDLETARKSANEARYAAQRRRSHEQRA